MRGRYRRAYQPYSVRGYHAPLAVLVLLLPSLTNPYQVLLLSYGLITAIAALGFNLLLVLHLLYLST